MDSVTILSLEDARCQAMVDGDEPAMRRLFADGLQYTHSYGVVDTKESLIGLITSKTLDYRGIHRSEIVVQITGSTAVVTGRARLELIAQGAERTVHCRFTVTWADLDHEPRFAAWQSTAVASPED